MLVTPGHRAMATKTVRLYTTDAERVPELSGLDPSAPFPAHLNAVLRRAEEATEIDRHVRQAVRDELGDRA